ncbi:MAG: ATP-binding protein [Acidimicrobiales bacterium]|nr:ATP-binding protein [Acidimicrobiales bacterium]
MGLNGESQNLPPAGLRCHVVVTGPPGSGKTMLARPLARALGIPLLSKDDIKEALFDELGTGDRLWARRLGRASITVLYRLAADCPSAVIEAVFQRDAAMEDLHSLGTPLIEIHCRCAPETAIERFEQRADTDRHPGHLDYRQPRNKLEQLVHEGSAPLGLGGSLLEIDTSDLLDLDAIVEWVRTRPEWDSPQR